MKDPTISSTLSRKKGVSLLEGPIQVLLANSKSFRMIARKLYSATSLKHFPLNFVIKKVVLVFK